MGDFRMEDQLSRFQHLGQLMQSNGLDMISSLLILIIGLISTKWVVKKIRILLNRFIKNTPTVSVAANSTGVVLLGLVITASAMGMGANPGPLVTLMMIIVLVAIGVILVFRPLIPTLPFKVGNYVKVGTLLGKVEATTVLNTRLRTFDGKTFFVPNRQILDDIVINYHYTKTRRVKIYVTIRYDQDLIKAKQVLEAVMIEDARVLPKPNPQVYVLDLGSNGVRLGGRCWVNNLKFWVTKCDLLEKTKVRFDRENIEFAHHQLDINYKRIQEETAEDMIEPMPGE
jgi:small conductance mechanosensitive channel